MAHRKWKEIKQQPSMLPGPAVPGSCLASFYFRWAIHPIRPVYPAPDDSVVQLRVVTGILVYLAVERCVTGDFELNPTIMLITSGVGVLVNIM